MVRSEWLFAAHWAPDLGRSRRPHRHAPFSQTYRNYAPRQSRLVSVAFAMTITHATLFALVVPAVTLALGLDLAVLVGIAVRWLRG